MKSRTTRALIALLLAGTIAPVLAGAETKAEGSRLFDKECASCHGKDGRAKTFRAKFNKARDLTDAQWQEVTSDAAIVEIIMVGRDKMPAFANKLTDSQIAELAQYVRSFRQPSAALLPVQASPDAQGPSQRSP